MLFCLIFLAIIASLYFYKDWYKIQYKKIIGCHYVFLGDKAFRAKNYQKAIDNYQSALNYYPQHAKAGWNLGNIYVSFENYYEAINCYEKALKYSPNFMACRMDLGIILSEELAEYDRAINEYEKVVNAAPFILRIPFVFDNKKTTMENKGLAYYNMGLAYRNKALNNSENQFETVKYLKKAKDSYEQAQKYLQNNYDNMFNLALTNHLLGDYSDAAEQYCSAINIKPINFEAHYNLGLLFRELNRQKEALDEFEKTNIVIDYNGEEDKVKHILGLITEIKRKIINESGYNYLKDREDITSLSKSEIIYSKGKITSSSQKEYDLAEILKCNYSDNIEKSKYE